MNLFEGAATFYRIEARNRCWKGNWGNAVGDHRGHPKGFTASDPVWQKYGVFGTEDLEVAKSALGLFAKSFPETDFRIVQSVMIMSHVVVGEEVLSECPKVPPTTASYPNDEHYEHLRRVAAVCEVEPADYVKQGSLNWRKKQLSPK